MRKITFAIVLCVTCASGAAAQDARPAALERLAPMIGTWTIQGLPKDVTLRETCEWAVGDRHLVCRMRSKSPAWQRETLTILSYNESDSTFTFYALGSGGQSELQRGRVVGDQLVLTGELRKGGRPVPTRLTITIREKGFDYVGEELANGAWTNAWRVSYVPASPL